MLFKGNLGRTALSVLASGLGAFTGGEDGWGEMGYEAARESSWGGWLKSLDGTALGAVLKNHWTNLAGGAASVMSAPGKFLKIMAVVGIGVGLYQSGLSETLKAHFDKAREDDTAPDQNIQHDSTIEIASPSDAMRKILMQTPSDPSIRNGDDTPDVRGGAAQDHLGATTADQIMADAAAKATHVGDASKRGTEAILENARATLENVGKNPNAVAQIEAQNVLFDQDGPFIAERGVDVLDVDEELTFDNE